MKDIVYYYLTVVAGARSGTNFVLDASGDPLKVGRGTDCDIILMDPLCSRVHAELYLVEGSWWLRDAGSRNGSFVNDQKIDEAQLAPGHRVKLGSTVFDFHRSDQPPTQASLNETRVTQTIIKEAALQAAEGESEPPAHKEQDPIALRQLYQLSLQLLSCDDPDDVVRASLHKLHEHAKASVVGFLWLSDEGQLKPKLVYPPDASEQVQLSESLTQVVCLQGHAVWIANQSAHDPTQSLRRYADAMCVPLLHDRKTLGALHAYREKGRFGQPDFDFCIGVANLVVVALVRARQTAVLTADHQRLKESVVHTDDLLGESDVMSDLKTRITRVSAASGSVLIRGESGAGKELVAQAVHRAGPRADRPLLSVNCAAIPQELMESQLFGHMKGAFTGADRDHRGWFQQADSGTLFLDEIGELNLAGQAKLLRILEGHPFLPVGSADEVRVDVRVIAATNRDLREFVKAGKFREDLYYRLAVFELVVPPLRDRGSDIDLLIDHFFVHFRAKHGRPNLQLSDAARQRLRGYHWPGNVRQLRNVIDSVVVMAESNEVMPQECGLHDAGIEPEIASLKISDWEQKLIREALRRSDGSVPEAALLLGIGRATLYRKIDEYGIER